MAGVAYSGPSNSLRFYFFIGLPLYLSWHKREHRCLLFNQAYMEG